MSATRDGVRGMFAAVVLLLTACAQPPSAKPDPLAFAAQIITREQWGSVPAAADNVRKQDIRYITLHHGGVEFTRGRDMQQYLRDLQAWSRREKKWIDVPYHYLIDLDGKVYEGRPIAYAGDTNTEYDPLGHALIEVVGNYEEIEPSPAQLAAVADTMAMLAAKYQVPTVNIRGHRDYSKQTVCPGKNLYRYLQSGYFREQVDARLTSR